MTGTDTAPETKVPTGVELQADPSVPAFSWFLATRFLLSRWIHLIGLLGVAVGVWALIVVIAVFSGFITQIRGGIERASPDLLCVAFEGEREISEIDALLADDPDVVASSPRLRHYGMVFPHDRRSDRVAKTPGLLTSTYDFVEIVGIDYARENAVTGMDSWFLAAERRGLAPERVDGDPLMVPRESVEDLSVVMNGGPAKSEFKDEHGLLLSTKRIDRGLLRPGQWVSLTSGSFAEDEQFIPAQNPVVLSGGFLSDNSAIDDTTGFVSIRQLTSMISDRDMDVDPEDEMATFFDIDEPLFTEYALRCRDGADLRAAADRLSETLGATVWTWEEQNETILGAVEQERSLMKLTLFAVVLVAAFLIYATLHMMVTQKTREIGVLQAMGASPRGILQIFVGTGAVLGFCGCLLGTGLGILSAVYLNDINDWTEQSFGLSLFPKSLFALNEIPYVLEASWILQVALGAFLVTLLAAWLPARRAARLTPVRALAHES